MGDECVGSEMTGGKQICEEISEESRHCHSVGLKGNKKGCYI